MSRNSAEQDNSEAERGGGVVRAILHGAGGEAGIGKGGRRSGAVNVSREEVKC